MCVVKLLSNRYSYSFSLILTKLGNKICLPIHTNLEHILEILILKILVIFFKISHLDLVSGPAAVEQSRPTGLCQEIKFRIVVARQSMI